MTLPRSFSAPWRANSAIWPGPGRPATSGGWPLATPSQSIPLRSRVPTYWTVTPDCCSNGRTMAMKASSSVPSHEPTTWTMPPSWPSGAAVHAPAPTSANSAKSETNRSLSGRDTGLFLRHGTPQQAALAPAARVRVAQRPPKGAYRAVVAILPVPMARQNRDGGRSRVMRTLNLLAFLPLAPRMPLYARLLMSLAADPRVPGSRKALLALAAAYVASPWDLVPDRLPFLGGLDDVVVVVLAVDAFLEGMPVGLVDE